MKPRFKPFTKKLPTYRSRSQISPTSCCPGSPTQCLAAEELTVDFLKCWVKEMAFGGIPGPYFLHSSFWPQKAAPRWLCSKNEHLLDPGDSVFPCAKNNPPRKTQSMVLLGKTNGFPIGFSSLIFFFSAVLFGVEVRASFKSLSNLLLFKTAKRAPWLKSSSFCLRSSSFSYPAGDSVKTGALQGFSKPFLGFSWGFVGVRVFYGFLKGSVPCW